MSVAPMMFGPDFDRDPSAAYDWLRRNEPVHRIEFPGGLPAWLITRHQDAVRALTEPSLAKHPTAGNVGWQESGMGLPLDHRPSLASHMINADPPDHQRLRKACAGAFGPRRVNKLRLRAEALTAELLSGITARGKGDLVDELAYPLPIAMICDLLGVPEQHREEVRRCGMAIDSSDGTDNDPVLEATNTLDTLIAELVELRRHEPGADLVSDLVQAEREGNLNADEVTSTVFLILIGGYETTVGLIGSMALALLTHPDEAARARTDAAHRTAIVEEILRLQTPTQNATWRFPTVPVSIGGQTLQPGDPILVSLLSANRDSEVFDEPNAFRPGQRERHIAFGTGPHVCIGAALARLQGEVVLSAMLSTLSTAQLAVPEETLTWWPSPITRGLYSLPITL